MAEEPIQAAPEDDKRQVLRAQHLENIAWRMSEGLIPPLFLHFGDLMALNLLTLQAELQQLRTEYYRTEKPNAIEKHISDATQGPSTLPEEIADISEKALGHKLQLLKALKEKLKEYNSALLEAAQIKNLNRPEERDIDYFHRLLDYVYVGRGGPETKDTVYTAEMKQDDFVLLGYQAQQGSGIKFKNKLIMAFCLQYWRLLFRRMVGKSQTPKDRKYISSLHAEILLGESYDKARQMELVKKNAFISRLFMALFGGIALIVPTTIMAKNPGINISLLTTAVATFSFAVLLAGAATDSSGKDVLAATAAYSAVLVVFIGTSLATPPAVAGGTAAANLSSA